MTLSPSEAAAALRDIDDASSQSRRLLSYRIASDYLLLWGLLWLVAGMAAAFFPQATGTVWLIVDAIGVPASIWAGLRGAHQTGSGAEKRWAMRYTATIAIYVLFAVGVMFLFRPTSDPQIMTFFALLIGSMYAGIGIWFGARYILIGATLSAIAVTAYWLHLPHADVLISLAGGLAMIVGGFWMRRA